MEWYEYFQSHAGYFWQWEEEGEVLAIPNSNTIAYRAFVTEALEHLCVQGIPRFGSLLLCLIATNPGGEDALNNVYALMDIRLKGSNSTREPLKSAIVFLKILSQLPEKYKTGKNRLLLLSTLFEERISIIQPEIAKTFVESLKANRHDQKFLAVAAFRSVFYNSDFRTIYRLAAIFPDTKTILARLADVPIVEDEIKWEKPATEQPGKKDFIQELIDHTNTFHVGSLIKSLWSSLQIPHHYHLPSQQPIGGIADLTNKGSLDRLLLSEFAHEELVFLSRLANNEALYINREMPPQHNRLERVILIDVSIKSWGTPKTLAYALLLAIARHPKTNIPCSAFAIGKECHSIAFGSVDEVIASMQVLEPCLHPAEGMEAFFNMGVSLADKEIIFIAANEVFEQPQLRKTISDYQHALHYLIRTDSEGNIDIYRKQQNGRKHIQNARLDLAKLWKSEKPVEATATEEPAKFVYPILFPVTMHPKKKLLADDGSVFLITAERALLHSVPDKDGKGWEMLYEDLPFNSGEVEIGTGKNGECFLLLFNVSYRQVTIINLTTGKRASTSFHHWRWSAYENFIFYKDRFIYSRSGYHNKHWLFSLEDEVAMELVEHIPQWIIDRNLFRKEELDGLRYSDRGLNVLKNVKKVYINEANELIFNFHELKLIQDYDQLNLRLMMPVSAAGKIRAVRTGKKEFRFPDGSKVFINHSGMFILKSSDLSISTIYLPAVLDSSIGIATDDAMAGNNYYCPRGITKEAFISLPEFWRRYMIPFIDTIISHGTADKTPS